MTKRTYTTQRRGRGSGERGVALVTTLLALGLTTILGVALTGTGMEAVTITTNAQQATEVLYIADAGIEHARALTNTLPMAEVVDLLVVGDGTPCNGDELSTQPIDPIPAAAAGGQPFPPAGRYEVQVCQDAQARIVIVSTGFGRNGATATVEIILDAFVVPALLVDGNLRFNGNPIITGDEGAVHSNGTLEINGSSCAEQYFSAGGSVTGTGDPLGGAGCTSGGADVRSGEEEIQAPLINPANLGADADYTLTDTGQVLDSLGNVIGGNVWEDWTWDVDKRLWDAGNDILPGTYYAQGSSIKIAGNPGEGDPDPISLTLIADGHIEIGGNPMMDPALVTGGVTYSMVAGLDLKISGNPANPYEGVHYAGHQIDFSGDPDISGQVLAANLDDFAVFDENLVALDMGFMQISGNQVLDSLGNVIGGNVWEDWAWDVDKRLWDAGNDILPGTYYAQGSSIKIAGNPGEGDPDPISLTLIADGHIDISGNPMMDPALVTGGVGT